MTILLAMLALSLTHSTPTPVRLETVLKTPSPMLGAAIEVLITAKWPKGTTLVPTWRREMPPFEVLSIDESEPHDQGNWIEQQWTLRLITFNAGRLIVPSAQFVYEEAGSGQRRAVSTPPLTLDIGEVVVDVDGDLRPIEHALNEDWAIVDVAWATLTLGLIATAIVAVAGRLRRVAHVTRESIPGRGFDAAASLVQLEAALPSTDKDVAPFYAAVSAVVRRFVESTYAVPATTQSSSETLQDIADRPALKALRQPLSVVMTTADRVKFAAHRPRAAEHEVILQQARRIISDGNRRS